MSAISHSGGDPTSTLDVCDLLARLMRPEVPAKAKVSLWIGTPTGFVLKDLENVVLLSDGVVLVAGEQYCD